MLWKHMHARRGIVLACVLGAGACDKRTDDNWPTYEVRGSVVTAAGAPVTGVLVEMETYSEAACGTAPLWALSWSTTDATGRYRVQQDEPSGILNGCLRLIAHPDTSGFSEPTAVVDLPVDSVLVLEGETFFTVDLTVP